MDQLAPKHNEDIRDVVHPGPVHIFGFFVSRGHEQQTTCYEELHNTYQELVPPSQWERGSGQLTKGERYLKALNGETPLLVGVSRGDMSSSSSLQGLGVVSLCATKHTSVIRVIPATAKV